MLQQVSPSISNHVHYINESTHRIAFHCVHVKDPRVFAGCILFALAISVQTIQHIVHWEGLPTERKGIKKRRKTQKRVKQWVGPRQEQIMKGAPSCKVVREGEGIKYKALRTYVG